MKKILPNQDIEFKIELLDENDDLINYNLFETYTITAYTTDIKDGVVYDRTNITDYVLHISSLDLSNMKNGTLHLKYEINLKDTEYEDGNFTKSGIITTRWYVDFGKDNNENNCICRSICN